MIPQPAEKKGQKSTLGPLGEALGCRYLAEKGYQIVERNYQNRSGYRLGEIDIIAKKGKSLIFVEVKTRAKRSGEDLLPEEAISREKLRKLVRISEIYLRDRRLKKMPYQFDALAVVVDRLNGTAKIRHLEHIFL